MHWMMFGSLMSIGFLLVLAPIIRLDIPNIARMFLFLSLFLLAVAFALASSANSMSDFDFSTGGVLDLQSMQKTEYRAIVVRHGVKQVLGVWSGVIGAVGLFFLGMACMAIMSGAQAKRTGVRQEPTNELQDENVVEEFETD